MQSSALSILLYINHMSVDYAMKLKDYGLANRLMITQFLCGTCHSATRPDTRCEATANRSDGYFHSTSSRRSRRNLQQRQKSA